MSKRTLAVFGASVLFFSRNDLIAYFNCKAVGLLFQPKRPRIFEKKAFSACLVRNDMSICTQMESLSAAVLFC